MLNGLNVVEARADILADHTDSEGCEAERGEEMVTVRVVDNGPGIPERLRDAVFETGEKNFESPEIGFGLYLIREVVDSDGGAVTVAENDPKEPSSR